MESVLPVYNDTGKKKSVSPETVCAIKISFKYDRVFIELIDRNQGELQKIIIQSVEKYEENMKSVDKSRLW